jgi:hypothetical protein
VSAARNKEIKEQKDKKNTAERIRATKVEERL